MLTNDAQTRVVAGSQGKYLFCRLGHLVAFYCSRTKKAILHAAVQPVFSGGDPTIYCQPDGSFSSTASATPSQFPRVPDTSFAFTLVRFEAYQAVSSATHPEYQSR